MRSSTAACSRMTWPVIGSLRPLTISASRRSTRNWISTSSSGSPVRVIAGLSGRRSSSPIGVLGAEPVAQEEQALLADPLLPHHARVGRRRGQVLAVRTGHEECVAGERRTKARVSEGRFRRRNIRERRIAKHEIELSAVPRAEKADHAGADDRRTRPEAGRLEVLAKRPHRLRVALDERNGGGATRERLDAERARAREEVEHARAAELRLEDGKQRLADAVRRRARPT